jgi:hypothetical protein
MNSRGVYLCQCFSTIDGTNNCMLLQGLLIGALDSLFFTLPTSTALAQLD